MPSSAKRYHLLGPLGPYDSATPGTVGGHRGQRIYGQLDCPSALRFLAKGQYASQRVFFRDEADARATGYRPCAACMRPAYEAWKASAGDRAALVTAAQAVPARPLGPEFSYPHLVQAVTDAIFSIGVRYETTRATVQRLTDAVALDPDRPDALSPGQLARRLRLAPDHGADTVFGNRQRTSTGPAGILKAEAVARASELLAAHEIRTVADLQALSPEQTQTLEAGWRAIPGQTSGISWRYFEMMTGRAAAIKPDRMIGRWLTTTIGRVPPDDEAAALLQWTAAAIGLTPRELDYRIWSHVREQPTPVAAARASRPSRGA